MAALKIGSLWSDNLIFSKSTASTEWWTTSSHNSWMVLCNVQSIDVLQRLLLYLGPQRRKAINTECDPLDWWGQFLECLKSKCCQSRQRAWVGSSLSAFRYQWALLRLSLISGWMMRHCLPLPEDTIVCHWHACPPLVHRLFVSDMMWCHSIVSTFKIKSYRSTKVIQKRLPMARSCHGR